MNSDSKDRLVSDLKNVAYDAEDLLKESAGELAGKARDARAQLVTALERARDACGRLEEKAVAGAKAADQVVREHPYQSIGIAFGLGVLIGVLVGRK